MHAPSHRVSEHCPILNTSTKKMPGNEKFKKFDSDSESESDEEEIDVIPKVEVDTSKLTPLSPEVISKQVRYTHRKFWDFY